MNTVGLQNMRELAGAATPGEWKAEGVLIKAAGTTDTVDCLVWGSIVVCKGTYKQDAEGREWNCKSTPDQNAAFIAACHPAAILELLDDNDRFKKAYKERLQLESEIAENLGMEVSCGFLEEMADNVVALQARLAAAEAVCENAQMYADLYGHVPAEKGGSLLYSMREALAAWRSKQEGGAE